MSDIPFVTASDPEKGMYVVIVVRGEGRARGSGWVTLRLSILAGDDALRW